MKRSLCLCAFLLTLLTACYDGQRREMLALLDEADSLNRAYAQLPSDTLLLEAADFFDRHGSANEQVRAHYLLGCAYRDMGQAPEALQAWQNAIDRADTTARDCDFQRLMAVYGQMADLYHSNNLPFDELSASQIYGRYALLVRDTIKYIHNLETTSKAYDLLGDTTRMLAVLDSARNLYEKAGCHQEAIRTISPSIYVNLSRGKIKEAKERMELYESESGLFDSIGDIEAGCEAYYYFKGLYYVNIGYIDSADYYMRKLLHIGNHNVNAYRGLLEVYRQRKQYDSVALYSVLLEASLDSFANARRTEVVRRTSELYKYQRFQLAAEKAFRTAGMLRMIVVFVIVLFVLGISISFYLYRQYKYRKLAEITQLSNEYFRTTVDYQKVSNELELLGRNLDAYKSKKEREVKKLKDMLISYEERWQKVSIDQKESAFRNSYIVKLLQEKSKGGLKNTLPTANQWNHFLEQFAQNMPAAYAAIGGRKTELSSLEFKTCALVMLGFQNGPISVLLDVTPQRISNIKKRINHKLFNDSSASNLEDHLERAVFENSI